MGYFPRVLPVFNLKIKQIIFCSKVNYRFYCTQVIKSYCIHFLKKAELEDSNISADIMRGSLDIKVLPTLELY